MSEAFYEVIDFPAARFRAMLEWDERGRPLLCLLSSLREALHNMGCPIDNIVGFLDGTFRPSCRPILFQELSCFQRSWIQVPCKPC
jgi:hypothetical protein